MISILWRRLDLPGHDSARLTRVEPRWHLDGTAVCASEQGPCRLDYRVVCDPAWHTLSGRVSGWVGSEIVEVDITANDGCWTLNDVECPDVAGCIDLDLSFTPATNLLPIRRLSLGIGDEAPVRSAWLRFPGFILEPLEQLYCRTGDNTYYYVSEGGGFTAELCVDDAGFVTDYPSVWRKVG